MRIFYEEWSQVFDARKKDNIKSPDASDEIAIDPLLPVKSSDASDDLTSFLNLSFSHHIVVLTEEKDVSKRKIYIRLADANHWSSRFLKQQIKENAAEKYGNLPSNFSNTIANSRDAVKALNMFKDEYLLDFINTEDLKKLL